jgi:hypothetical protein
MQNFIFRENQLQERYEKHQRNQVKNNKQQVENDDQNCFNLIGKSQSINF